MFCPLSPIRPQTEKPRECSREHCAWYDAEAQRCAVHVMCQTMKGRLTIASPKANKLPHLGDIVRFDISEYGYNTGRIEKIEWVIDSHIVTIRESSGRIRKRNLLYDLGNGSFDVQGKQEMKIEFTLHNE